MTANANKATSPNRQEKLAKALRANLKRRKEQARARDGVARQTETETETNKNKATGE